MQLHNYKKEVFFIFYFCFKYLLYLYINFFRRNLGKKHRYCVKSKTKVIYVVDNKVAKLILEKCNGVFSKINGWTELQKVNLIHNGTAINVKVEQYNSNDLVYKKYAPITLVDVERSFSLYKNISTQWNEF
jgi:hypothetical protein